MLVPMMGMYAICVINIYAVYNKRRQIHDLNKYIDN